MSEGYNGCCTGAGCTGSDGVCYCDQLCYNFGDCCTDILDIGCYSSKISVVHLLCMKQEFYVSIGLALKCNMFSIFL